MNQILANRLAAGADKRGAILSAALHLIAHSGLHNTPMSAIAREAGVAMGTIYIYFPGKEELINELYLELVRDRLATISQATDGDSSLREKLRSAWFGFARWHLSNPDASNFIQQCEVSQVLTAETRAGRAELEAEGRTNYARAVDGGIIWEMPVRVFHALFAGPIFELAHTRNRQDMEIDDEELHLAFEGVCRSVLRNPE